MVESFEEQIKGREHKVEKQKILQEITALLDNDPFNLRDELFARGLRYKPIAVTPEIIWDHSLSFIIGENPSHYSASVLMWNAEFKLRGEESLFLPADISPAKKENVSRLLSRAFDAGNALFRILTITNPYKVDALNHFKELKAAYPRRVEVDIDAERIGATNQILVGPDNVFHVINSDGKGMVQSIERHLTEAKMGQLAGKRVLLIGAGGAARGIAYEVAKGLGEQGVFSIANRTAEKAVKLAEELRSFFPSCAISGYPLEELLRLAGEHEVFVSSVTEGDLLQGVYAAFPRGALVVDANYGLKSVLAAGAKKAGRYDLHVKDGSGMVVEGYVIASQELGKLWGYTVPAGVYEKIGGMFSYIPKVASGQSAAER